MPELHSYEEVRRRAAKVLPPTLFEDMTHGTGRGVTARANEAAFDRVDLVPRAAVGWEQRSLTTTVLGTEVSMPVLAAPVGGLRMVHPDGAPGVAEACGRAGTIAVVSMMAGHGVDAVADRATGPVWQQVYLSHGHERCAQIIADARRRGFSAIVVTVDCPVSPKRPVGLSISLASARAFGPELVRRPGWTARFLRDGADLAAAQQAMGPRLRQTALWSDLAWLRQQWGGPLVVKGIVTAADARRAADAGVDAIVVSNHGGMSLDGSPATLSALPAVVAEVGSEVEVYLDGGVRQGSDVLRALGLGARAVLVGRPTLLGLAVGGAAGVTAVFELLRHQLDVSLAMVGAEHITDIDPTYVRAPQSWSSVADPSTHVTIGGAG
ncbi:alpha-hydroxy acid oxidase [Nocardioides mangrovi]|uniref:Alpha-hydroxy-acid oxidizing protein n=1 Tax=Nocardioides mangrovi TaxID=2874580 RepID=A0ABS7UFZ2_9ACTN|nr:alpha-hydroxy acid oxidase [Nocardioides mangrovi]MBZ5739557.1 alpha-hydroxy-acid oxidizing protein [Nocardioides mangrovi]